LYSKKETLSKVGIFVDGIRIVSLVAPRPSLPRWLGRAKRRPALPIIKAIVTACGSDMSFASSASNSIDSRLITAEREAHYTLALASQALAPG
jgi:hypothetical protein